MVAQLLMVEERVTQLLLRDNKPFSVQTITGNLAQYGIKKGQVQKAVDVLSSESGSITCKEFGKSKLYFPSQANTAVVSAEDMEARKAEQAQLTQQVAERAEHVKALKSELQALRNCMSVEEVESRCQQLQAKVETDEQKLMQLQSGAELISAEDRQKVETKFAAIMEHWQKRRRIFKSLWGAVSENIDRKKSEVFEEIGVEANDDEDWRQLSEQLPNKRRRT